MARGGHAGHRMASAVPTVPAHAPPALPRLCKQVRGNEGLSHPLAQTHPNMVTGRAAAPPARLDQRTAAAAAQRPRTQGFRRTPHRGDAAALPRGTSRQGDAMARRGSLGAPTPLRRTQRGTDRDGLILPALLHTHSPGHASCVSPRNASGSFKTCSPSRNMMNIISRANSCRGQPEMKNKPYSARLSSAAAPSCWGRSLLGASGHLDLEIQSLEGQSKVGEGPEGDPAVSSF